MLRAVGERGSAPDQIRKRLFKLWREAVIVVAEPDMVENVIEKVERMKTFALDRRLTASFLLALGEVLGRSLAI